MTGVAKILHVSRPTLSSLLNARADLSGDMALRFEKAFGVEMDTLMRMQNSWDIALREAARKKFAWSATSHDLRLEGETEREGFRDRFSV